MLYLSGGGGCASGNRSEHLKAKSKANTQSTQKDVKNEHDNHPMH